MSRIKIVLAYVGTGFNGWQIQAGGRTVQGVVETCLARLCADRIRVHGSGRTDSGVHALGQVAHFDPPAERFHIPWQRALNSVLPPDISVIHSETVNDSFHARFSATAKEYSYTLWLEPDFVLPQRMPFVWAVGPLDVNAMDAASKYLIGEHDFSAFQNVGTTVSSTHRTIHALDIDTGPSDRELVLRFRADGFLKQMVRNLVGLLHDVGRGRTNLDRARSILKSGDRALGPATAPARGLCLERVFYPEDEIPIRP
ncbi:MAG: tRNA pseudouridine(38-40) synthase TruA [Deltaproteobacteria bacterium]|nr:tRNA pseudouridine(38-40) synthase TruA [Deltaproteobacteria bacterium]